MHLVRKALDTDAGRISYLEGPASGLPMVWLHGVSRRAESFRPQLKAFAPSWHVFAPDARGHGRSSRVPGKYSWCDHAGDLLVFLRRVVQEPAVLVGHSLGALQSLAAASEVPQLVLAAILEDPPLYSGERDDFDFGAFESMELAASAGMAAEQILAAWPAEPWMTEAFRRDQAESLTELDPENLRVSIDGSATRGFDVDACLTRVGCPVLLLRAGGPNPALRDQDERRALSRLADAHAVLFQDSGHLIHAQHPGRYLQAIEEFLSRVRPASLSGI